MTEDIVSKNIRCSKQINEQWRVNVYGHIVRNRLDGMGDHFAKGYTTKPFLSKEHKN